MTPAHSGIISSFQLKEEEKRGTLELFIEAVIILHRKFIPSEPI
jgi:hypothetical protein